MRKVFPALLAAVVLYSAPSFAEGDTDRELKELQQNSENLQKTVDQVRRTLEQRMQGFDRQSLERGTAKVMQLTSDPAFLKAVGDLWGHPDRQKLLVAELVFALFMFFFKAWRQARARNWFTKLMTGVFLSAVTWLGIVLVLPALILGEPFRTFVKSLYRFFTT